MIVIASDGFEDFRHVDDRQQVCLRLGRQIGVEDLAVFVNRVMSEVPYQRCEALDRFVEFIRSIDILFDFDLLGKIPESQQRAHVFCILIYIACVFGQITRTQFAALVVLEQFLPVELKLAYYMGWDIDSEEMHRMKWLGVFEDKKVGLKNATPALQKPCARCGATKSAATTFRS